MALAAEPKKPEPAPCNVAIFVHQGVKLLDLARPAEVFAAAGRGGAFNVYTVAAAKGYFVSQGFLTVAANLPGTVAEAGRCGLRSARTAGWSALRATFRE
jgi:putative intracellular protease/amidase